MEGHLIHLVGGHVSVHISRVAAVDHKVLPGVSEEGAVLDAGQRRHPHLAHHVRAARPALLPECAVLGTSEGDGESMLVVRHSGERERCPVVYTVF